MNYGDSVDQKNSGKKFSFHDTCPDSGTVHITLYHTGKILLQAEKNNHSINIHFVNSHLEELYTQVYSLKPQISVHGVKVPTDSLKQSPAKIQKTKGKPFSCTNCEYRAPSNQSMVEHTENVHHPILNESVQQSVETETHDIENHESLNEQVRFQCKDCEEDFDTEQKLKNHVDSKHENIISGSSENLTLDEASESINCEKCNFTTDNHELFRTHIVISHTTILNCNVCDLTFFSDDLLKQHSMSYHPVGNTTTEVKCERCEKTFQNIKDLNAHVCEIEN